jgi:hypothetical protein
MQVSRWVLQLRTRWAILASNKLRMLVTHALLQLPSLPTYAHIAC